MNEILNTILSVICHLVFGICVSAGVALLAYLIKRMVREWRIHTHLLGATACIFQLAVVITLWVIFTLNTYANEDIAIIMWTGIFATLASFSLIAVGHSYTAREDEKLARREAIFAEAKQRLAKQNKTSASNMPHSKNKERKRTK